MDVLDVLVEPGELLLQELVPAAGCAEIGAGGDLVVRIGSQHLGQRGVGGLEQFVAGDVTLLAERRRELLGQPERPGDEDGLAGAADQPRVVIQRRHVGAR